MDLHGQIMNLGAVEPAEYDDAAVRMAYRVGHRDARHAAAELALKADAELDALRKDAARYRWIRTAGAWESEAGLDMLSERPSKFDEAVDTEMRGQP